MTYYPGCNSVGGYTNELDIHSSITTSQAYNENLNYIDEDEIVTIYYRNTITNQLKHLLFLNYDPTENQINALLDILFEFFKIEDLGANILGKIDISDSVENEIVFSRSSTLGVTLLSIDSDGDLLFNFTGFKNGFDTKHYSYTEEIDFENLIYLFLSR